MADEIKSNLEPIEEVDMNLKEKFVGAEEAKKPEGKIEAIHSIEGEVAKKEGASEKEAAYSKILSKIGSQKQVIHSEEDVSKDAQKVNAGIDAESKIINLVKLAENKGIAHAVKVARHLEDNYTLDEFHDRLLGEELHKALVEKGMIKEI
jgi:hypothetical protein